MLFRRFFSVCLSLVFIVSSTAHAQITTPLGATPNTGREYFVGTSLGEPLFTVNLVNGVNNPGVYHVPASTDMAQLFSYAGGVTQQSDLESVVVRSFSRNGASTVAEYDFEDSFSDKSGKIPQLNDRDLIYIEQNVLLDESMKWMTIASMAASIAAALIVIEDRR